MAEQRTALRFDDTFTRVTATGYRTPTGCWSWPAIQWLSAISGPNRFRGVVHSVSHFRSFMRQRATERQQQVADVTRLVSVVVLRVPPFLDDVSRGGATAAPVVVQRDRDGSGRPRSSLRSTLPCAGVGPKVLRRFRGITAIHRSGDEADRRTLIAATVPVPWKWDGGSGSWRTAADTLRMVSQML